MLSGAGATVGARGGLLACDPFDDSLAECGDVVSSEIVRLPFVTMLRPAPDRWTDRFEDELPDYAYFPFGGGPRHCIGMRFATAELKLALPTVFRAVDLELRSDPEPDLAVAATAQPESAVVARVHRRD